MAVCILLVLPILHNLWCVGLICVGLCGVHTVSLTCVGLCGVCTVNLTCVGLCGTHTVSLTCVGLCGVHTVNLTCVGLCDVHTVRLTCVRLYAHCQSDLCRACAHCRGEGGGGGGTTWWRSIDECTSTCMQFEMANCSCFVVPELPWIRIHYSIASLRLQYRLLLFCYESRMTRKSRSQ